MTDNLDSKTEDHDPHPIEHEPGTDPTETDHAASHFGNRCLLWGVIITGGTFLSAVAFATAMSADQAGVSSDIRMFLILGIMSAVATGAALIIIGGVDRLIRPLRARQRTIQQGIIHRGQMIDQIGEHLAGAGHRLTAVEFQLDGLERDFNTRFTQLELVIENRMSAVEQRITAVQEALEAVPGYGEGVIAGVQMRSDALGPQSR